MATVTILRPPLLVPTWSDSGPLTPPIGPAYLAASLRQAGHVARIVDGLGENPSQVTRLFDDRVMAIGLRSEEIVERIEPSDLIGISCMFSQDWPEIRRLIQMVRRRFPSIPIVAGGEHITATAGFTLDSTPEVDVCVIGEGEETIVELAGAVQHGTPFDAIAGLVLRADKGSRPGLVLHSDKTTRSTGSRTRIRNLDEIPWPAWDLVPLANYLDNGLGYGVDRGRSMPMIATRGCPYQCTFCSNPEMWTTRWYARDPEQVLDEIQTVPGALRRDELRLLRPDRDREAKLDHPVHEPDPRAQDGVHLAAPERHPVGGDRRRGQPAAVRVGLPEHELRARERLAGSAEADQESRQARSARSVGPRRGAQRTERQAEHHHGVPERVPRRSSGRRCVSSPGWGSSACTT